MPRRAREYLYRSILILVSTAAALAMMEIGLRLFLTLAEPTAVDPEEALRNSQGSGLEAGDSPLSLKGLVRASAHPDVVYELEPGLSGTYLGQPVRTSSYGLRDREYLVEKPADTYRIVGLGDSVMFGWGVAQEEPFLEVLERRLAATPRPNRDFEVLNFGVPGYNTTMEIATLEHRALRFDPDLIVIDFVGNDLKLPHFLLRPRDFWTLRRSVLKDLVVTRLNLLKSTQEERLLPHDLRDLSREDQERAREQYRHMEGEDGFRRAAARLAELTRDPPIPVIFIVADKTAMPWSLAVEAAELYGFEILEVTPYLGAYLIEHGIENSVRGWSQAFWLSDRDRHPNASTHELYAQALIDKLRALEVLSDAEGSVPEPD